MSGPGEYRADATEGITRVEDLPKALWVQRSHSYRVRTSSHISSRIALDMEREERSARRALTTQVLHRAHSQAAA
jgi:hypothetical protein